ncbi:MAG TPA: YicC/YloC family endoribonuclease [Syntrophobacteria bacterium]|nr:YicC/YloC family endoribonuclease [Syntrophobacteria bacterium]
MLHSMTAFGRGEAEADGYRFTVEVRSVNHRFCDIQVKLPRRYSHFEEEVRRRVASAFSRGRIEVNVTADEALEKAEHLTVDLDLTKTYVRLLRSLQEELGLGGDIPLEALLTFRDIFTVKEDEATHARAWAVLAEALDGAVAASLRMRAEEGAAIAADFSQRLQHLDELVGEIEARAPVVTQEARDRIRERIQVLLGDVPLDEARLAQEAAILADKNDITEELVRLRSHVQQFRAQCQADGPRGRQLEFLLQEIHREINTVGSKANDLAVGQRVIQAKAELERVREQVQNVE